jgi:hypothetical protein
MGERLKKVEWLKFIQEEGAEGRRRRPVPKIWSPMELLLLSVSDGRFSSTTLILYG